MLQSETEKHRAYAVGLDASLTSFGVYCQPIGHDEWYGFTVTTGPKDGTDTARVVGLAQTIIEALNGLPHPVAIACFEDYGPISKRAGKITARAELCGMLKLHVLQSIAAPVITVLPRSLKAFATGSVGAQKDEMIRKAASHGFFADTSDEADAFFAARLAYQLHQGERVGVDYTRTNPMD